MLEKFKASSAFGQAKLAVILFAKEFTRRFPQSNVTVNCFHPGVMYNDPDGGIAYKYSPPYFFFLEELTHILFQGISHCHEEVVQALNHWALHSHVPGN